MGDSTRRLSRKAKITIGVLIFLVVAFFGGRFFLYVKIKAAIEDELRSLKGQEIDVSYDHFEVHPWSGKLEFLQLHISVRKDGDGKEGLRATIPYIVIKGIDLIPFLRSKTLSLHSILAQDAFIVYSTGSTILEKDSSDTRDINLQNIAIGNVSLPGIDLYVRGSTKSDTLAHLLADVEMNDLFLKKQLDSMIWERGQINIQNLAVKAHQSNYGFSFRKAKIDVEERTVAIDSFLAQPVIGKVEYMKFKGKQTDWIKANVPAFSVSGIRWFVRPKPTVTIEQITTRFYLDVYRDKRFPFLDRFEKKLPSHVLQNLPFDLFIDTILIKKSYISYEEQPEQGDEPGNIFFDNLYATIRTVHNTPKLKRAISMTTKARFMGSGDLNAKFTFPYDTTGRYTASGTLENMPLSSMNSMLLPAAKARIDRGLMKQLAFEFSYTNHRSEGKVKLNYENLKIVTLRDNKNNEQKVSHLKTLLLNTFIIKKDMNEDMEDDDRTGTINQERDRERSVFNFWWKSVLSGLKSAYNLDNLPIAGNKSKKDAANDEEASKRKKGIKGIFSKIF